jgi:hypothetical protein
MDSIISEKENALSHNILLMGTDRWFSGWVSKLLLSVNYKQTQLTINSLVLKSARLIQAQLRQGVN